MELKPTYIDDEGVVVETFNRTRMELKLVFR